MSIIKQPAAVPVPLPESGAIVVVVVIIFAATTLVLAGYPVAATLSLLGGAAAIGTKTIRHLRGGAR